LRTKSNGTERFSLSKKKKSLNFELCAYPKSNLPKNNLGNGREDKFPLQVKLIDVMTGRQEPNYGVIGLKWCFFENGWE